MMKRLPIAIPLAATLLGAVLLSSCTTLPPWKPIPTGSSVVYGQIQNYRRALGFVAYSDDPGIIAITVENRVDPFVSRYGMIVDQPARQTIQQALAKYAEWSKLAMENKVEITKEISSVSLPQMFLRSRGWEAEGSRNVTFTFSARLAGADTPRTTLVIRASAFFYGADQIVFNDEEAAAFARYVSDDEIDAGYQQAKKKQDTLNLFK